MVYLEAWHLKIAAKFVPSCLFNIIEDFGRSEDDDDVHKPLALLDFPQVESLEWTFEFKLDDSILCLRAIDGGNEEDFIKSMARIFFCKCLKYSNEHFDNQNFDECCLRFYIKIKRN